MEKVLIAFNLVMYLFFRGLLIASIVSCGADDSSDDTEKTYKASLWTDVQLADAVNVCSENAVSVTQETAPETCYCFYSHISKNYEYNVFIVNINEIAEDNEARKQECIDMHGERL